MRLFLIRVLVMLTAYGLCGSQVVMADNNTNLKYKEIDLKYRTATLETLLKLANDFQKDNVKDSALIYYSLIYNRPVDNQNNTSLRIIGDAMNEAGKIYFRINDYKSALNLWLKMLSLSEKINDVENIRAAYNNIAGIHFTFGEYNPAKKYYKMAYQQDGNQRFNFIILNNLGAIASEENKLDSAMFYFREAHKNNKDSTLYNTLNNIGETYRKKRMPDSAVFYYKAAIKSIEGLSMNEVEARIMSNIGKFYFDNNNIDSAKYYIEKSNKIAERVSLLDVLSENYLYSSEIAEKNGDKLLAFDFYKRYSSIKDSIFNTSKYSDINKLQFLYDMDKVDQRIQTLSTEQEVNRRTIKLQLMIQMITMIAFVITIITLIYIYIQKKRLNRSYDILVEKNIEIVNQDKNNQRQKADYESIISQLKSELKSNETMEIAADDAANEKSKRRNIDAELYNDIKARILNIMNNDPIIYSHEFSLSKLAEILGSNQTYVSQIINESFGKNFKPFVNGYRIKEALRLLQDPQHQKYTIESISVMVGFESRSSFNMVFKEITGVTPSFYARSISRKDKNKDI